MVERRQNSYFIAHRTKVVSSSAGWWMDEFYLCGSGDWVRGFHFCRPPPCQERAKQKPMSATPGRLMPDHTRIPPPATFPLTHTLDASVHGPVQQVLKPHMRCVSCVCVLKPLWLFCSIGNNGAETRNACLAALCLLLTVTPGGGGFTCI